MGFLRHRKGAQIFFTDLAAVSDYIPRVFRLSISDSVTAVDSAGLRNVALVLVDSVAVNLYYPGVGIRNVGVSFGDTASQGDTLRPVPMPSLRDSAQVQDWFFRVHTRSVVPIPDSVLQLDFITPVATLQAKATDVQPVADLFTPKKSYIAFGDAVNVYGDSIAYSRSLNVSLLYRPYKPRFTYKTLRISDILSVSESILYSKRFSVLLISKPYRPRFAYRSLAFSDLSALSDLLRGVKAVVQYVSDAASASDLLLLRRLSYLFGDGLNVAESMSIRGVGMAFRDVAQVVDGVAEGAASGGGAFWLIYPQAAFRDVLNATDVFMVVSRTISFADSVGVSDYMLQQLNASARTAAFGDYASVQDSLSRQ